ncbi:hypothetical protein EUX98_g4299 [Antrodiella citrinella]|uniref:Nephrocystin 3-like N-terminal domain-containing protein n=1 Tax=Antrodiella citrinella TaxID=2447956 RepID=A0A4S4MUH9_9APHY|nr:hypothetical protein EUX98_g4299 [Antrodiella citrinella]
MSSTIKIVSATVIRSLDEADSESDVDTDPFLYYVKIYVDGKPVVKSRSDTFRWSEHAYTLVPYVTLCFVSILVQFPGTNGDGSPQAKMGRPIVIPTLKTIEGPVVGLKELLNKVHAVYDVAQASEMYPVLSITRIILTSVLKALANSGIATASDTKITELTAHLNNAYNFVEDIQHINDSDHAYNGLWINVAVLILRQTIECALYIKDYYGLGTTGQATRISRNEAPQKLTEFATRIQYLEISQDDINIAVTPVVYREVFISDSVGVAHDAILLRRLNTYPTSAMARELPRCLPNTHNKPLDIVFDWLAALTPGERLLWLHGARGCGKTTMAATLSDFIRGQNRLGASIFFSVDTPAASSPAFVIQSIATQLSAFDPRIGAEVTRVLQGDANIINAPLSVQLTALIINPLSTMEFLDLEGPIIVILDGLDQCGTADTRRGLLSTLKNHISHLPRCLHIIVTSRMDHEIQDALTGAVVREMPYANPDLQKFCKHKLEKIRAKAHPYLNHILPGDLTPMASRLTKLAAKSFMLAAAVCEFISSARDPATCITSIMPLPDEGLDDPLDRLFMLAMKDIGHWGGFDPKIFRCVFSAVLSAEDPLTTNSIDSLFSLGTSAMSMIVRFRWTLLSWHTGDMIRMHPSFREYITDSSRCPTWFIHPSDYRGELAVKCLDHIHAQLHFDLVRALPVRSTVTNIRAWASETLQHACLYWVDYLQHRGVPDKLLLRFLLCSLGDWFTVTPVNVRRHIEILEIWFPNREQDSQSSPLTEPIATAAFRVIKAYANLTRCLPGHPIGRLESRLMLNRDGLIPRNVDIVIDTFLGVYFGSDATANEFRDCIQQISESEQELLQLVKADPEYSSEGWVEEVGLVSRVRLNKLYLRYAEEAEFERQRFEAMAQTYTSDAFSDDGTSFQSRNELAVEIDIPWLRSRSS